MLRGKTEPKGGFEFVITYKPFTYHHKSKQNIVKASNTAIMTAKVTITKSPVPVVIDYRRHLFFLIYTYHDYDSSQLNFIVFCIKKFSGVSIIR